MSFSMSSAASGTEVGAGTELGSTCSGSSPAFKGRVLPESASSPRQLRDELASSPKLANLQPQNERMTAEYFDWTTTASPVLIQDALRLFVVVAPLLFYRCSGHSSYRDNSFPRVFFPCDGYGQAGEFEMGIVHLSCRTTSPDGGVPVVTQTRGLDQLAEEGSGHSKKQQSNGEPDELMTEPCTTADSEELGLDAELIRQGSEPLRVPAPGNFVKAVLDEAKDIFHDDPHLQRIASHFLSRFPIYDQIVISALLAERTDYSEVAPLNSAVVNTIYDIVKRHVAVLEEGVFTLKLRGTDLTTTRWYESCKSTFESRRSPLPTPAFVFNQFVDSTTMDPEYGKQASEAQQFTAIARQHNIATSMTRLVYPSFNPEWTAAKRAQASNEVFQAAGYRATPSYTDPVIQITSVGQITTTIVRLKDTVSRFTTGQHVLAVYPNSTVFYRAIFNKAVDGGTDEKGNYCARMKLVDPGYTASTSWPVVKPQGQRSRKNIKPRYVMPIPPQHRAAAASTSNTTTTADTDLTIKEGSCSAATSSEAYSAPVIETTAAAEVKACGKRSRAESTATLSDVTDVDSGCSTPCASPVRSTGKNNPIRPCKRHQSDTQDVFSIATAAAAAAAAQEGSSAAAVAPNDQPAAAAAAAATAAPTASAGTAGNWRSLSSADLERSTIKGLAGLQAEKEARVAADAALSAVADAAAFAAPATGAPAAAADAAAASLTSTGKRRRSDSHCSEEDADDSPFAPLTQVTPAHQPCAKHTINAARRRPPFTAKQPLQPSRTGNSTMLSAIYVNNRAQRRPPLQTTAPPLQLQLQPLVLDSNSRSRYRNPVPQAPRT
ncbi:hypothetical protein JKP88DRAFT_247560 [Tribonema minus]|uniref:SGF29 C-terminal domain-containing protein n=1 Tax=Tribonema minus TaxID=303371 RepID=A0A836CB96_9STRA|nr:hypothetical protein JKP88DRAFT_247560 [Tribonema minus]